MGGAGPLPPAPPCAAPPGRSRRPGRGHPSLASETTQCLQALCCRSSARRKRANRSLHAAAGAPTPSPVADLGLCCGAGLVSSFHSGASRNVSTSATTDGGAWPALIQVASVHSHLESLA